MLIRKVWTPRIDRKDISDPQTVKSSKKVKNKTKTKTKKCEGVLSEKEIFESTKNFQNSKSPGNDGLTKEFCYTFWDKIKQPFMNSMSHSKASHHQIIRKRNKDKRFICNWIPISLLNLDEKVI